MQTDPPKADPPKRKRRWFQFSLRSMLIFTLICAVACGWLGKRIEQKRKEREEVEAIVKLGGDVYYDYDHGAILPLGQTIPTKKPPGPNWLRSLFGENYFSEVDYVSIQGDVSDQRMADAGLVNLNRFPNSDRCLWRSTTRE
jgi:hypothetical protein